jgi:hypothetical protein
MFSVQNILLEFPKLVTMIRDSSNGSEDPLYYRVTMKGNRRGKDLFLDLRREPQHAHDLCYTGAGYALLAGDFRLSGDLAGCQKDL